MKDIAIYGAGGLGREVASMLLKYKNHFNWNFIGFFDDSKVKDTNISDFNNGSYKVLGGIVELNNWDSPLNIILAFGTPNSINLVRNKISNSNLKYPNIIDPNVNFLDSCTCELGMGNIICAGCSFTTNVKIGNFNLFNGEVVVGHDTKIGNYNVFMLRSNICGNVTIGDRNLFGMVSFVKQKLKVGCDVTISPLSAMLTNPRDGNTYIGNPARKFLF